MLPGVLNACNVTLASREQYGKRARRAQRQDIPHCGSSRSADRAPPSEAPA